MFDNLETTSFELLLVMKANRHQHHLFSLEQEVQSCPKTLVKLRKY